MEYSASFTAGALMREESLQVVEEIRRGVPPEAVDPDVLDVNSIRGRRRKTSEVVRRLDSADRTVWEDLPGLSRREQQIVLYYCCLKTYRLIFDFHMDVVLPQWRSLDRSLRPYDAQRYLEGRAGAHPELETWSETTREKVRQVMMKMLVEAGLLDGEQLQPPRLPDVFWKRFVKVGDMWFLEAAFLNKAQRNAVAKAVAS